MTPQYIVLTVTRVAVKNRNNPNWAKATVMQPPVRQLFVLPMMISKAQHGSNAEIELGDGSLLSVSEHFEDVVNAINDAAMGELAVAKPARRDMAEDAAAHASPLHKIAQEMRDGTAKFVSPRQAEGAKHQGEPVEPIGDPDPLTWDDAIPLTKQLRDPAPGDLRIVASDLHPAEFVVEVCRHADAHCVEGEKPVYEWTRADVPLEVRPFYTSRQAAREAVKLAGYIRRLIED